ncbi:MAG TPA: DUF4156 domain-containing protein [Nitrospirae bacterium]|nr:hypothetical protein BMS3Abin06_00605 [bacterium BMS3Abin06]HDH11432.1 DUF4156 domain-containing protein [Nitrospirota bacterium]HDL21215.1 DUF4156 domain-containing protein [Nitrospirota bacterium]HDZ01414.1 DUF4156 domain-containing protein [Nitrospirota bacterium]
MKAKNIFMFLIVMLLTGLLGCVPYLSKRSAGVQIEDNTKIFKNCKLKGTVKGSASVGLTKAHKVEIAIDEIKSKAALLGADTVLIVSKESMFKETVITGRAYDCPPRLMIRSFF